MKRRIRMISCFVLAGILFLMPIQVKATEIEKNEILEESVQVEKEDTVSETPLQQEDTETKTESEEQKESETEQETESQKQTDTEQKTDSEKEQETESEEQNDTEQKLEPEKEQENDSEDNNTGENGKNTETDKPAVKVSELDLGDYLEEMTVGEKQLLSVTVLPTNAGDTDISYHSSDSKVASVNGMGRITALKVGKTTISVTADEITQSFELQVSEEKDTTVPVVDIEIGEHEDEVEVDKTMSLSGTVLPSDATESTITYTSSNPAIATVSSTGEVKGISKGDVTITLTAGGVTKSVPLTVKVATTGITMNSEYLVLKTDETYQLSAKVVPAEAKQAITYQSGDTTVATVSPGGLVTAKGTGSTAIIVSNGDLSVAVSVIVNKAVEYDEAENVIEKDTSGEKTYEKEVLASEVSVIDSDMLYHLYDSQQVLRIIGEGYRIEIDGKDIINFNNEFYTDIALKKKKDTMKFTLNNGNELCGAITLYIEEPQGKCLYLYNETKEKYEWIQAENIGALKLTTAGQYMLSKNKIKADTVWLLYGAVAGVIVLLGLGAGYILVKKRYWFW